MPTIITRAQWGARAPREIQNVSTSKRQNFMVHHSGAPANQSVRVIQDFHMDTRGWSDIGYNFLIRDTGAIYEGRGWDRVGAHATGWNTNSIGVCVIGDYQSNDVPAPAMESLRWLYRQANTHVGRNLTILGHRDANHSTECPGDHLYGWVLEGLDGPVIELPPEPDHRPGSRELYLTDPPMRGDDVEFVQRFIGVARCGPPDGRYGPHTRAGVIWYQEMRGVHVDGRVGPQTWGQMGVRWTGR